jgi:nucleoside-diphosphate-sugar epimerase
VAAPLVGGTVVLVLGASNAVGRFFLERAGQCSGLQLLAVSRRLPEHSLPGTTWLQHDLNDGPVSVMATALVSFGPVSLALRQLQATPSLGRVIALSSASTEFKRDSADPAERAQMASIQADEEGLSGLCAARGVGLSLFKATMIYGGGDANVSRLADLAARLPVLPVAGNGLRQPVHADDLAELALRTLAMDKSSFGTWLLGGGETLDYRAMLRRIASAQGRKARLLPMPVRAMQAALKAAQLFGCLRDIRPVMLKRQAVDLVVDDQPARASLGWNPRPFLGTDA